MNSRRLVALAAVTLALASQAVLADSWKHGRDPGRDDGRHVEYARVVHVEPLVQRARYSVPVQHCWAETRYRDSYAPARGNNTGAALVGGAAGAVLGSQFGHGDARVAAAVAGAAIGAVIGHQVASNNDDRGHYQERCQTRQEVRYEEQVVGYRVTYAYRGRQMVTEMPHDPGPRIRIGVDVHPLY